MECLPLSESITVEFVMDTDPLADVTVTQQLLFVTYRGKTYTAHQWKSKKGKFLGRDRVKFITHTSFKSLTLKVKRLHAVKSAPDKFMVVTWDQTLSLIDAKYNRKRNIKYLGTIKKPKKGWDL